MHAGTEKGHEKTHINSVRSVQEVVLIFHLSIIFTRSFSKIKNVSERKKQSCEIMKKPEQSILMNKSRDNFLS